MNFQCHCYVCDSLAPCVNWITRISSADHCHATDKDEFWKALRGSKKKNDQKTNYRRVPESTGGSGGGGGDDEVGVSTTLVTHVNNVHDNNSADDDECVILDGDTNKPVSIPIQDDNNKGSGDESGDHLVVVSEKDQVLCYPFLK